MEPRYNKVLGTMKITLLYQVSHYIRVKKQRNIKSWDQQNYLVIRGICYIRPLYNEVPLYIIIRISPKWNGSVNQLKLPKTVPTTLQPTSEEKRYETSNTHTQVKKHQLHEFCWKNNRMKISTVLKKFHKISKVHLPCRNILGLFQT